MYDNDNGFGLWCLGCGEAFGFYGNDVAKMKEDILDKNFSECAGSDSKRIDYRLFE